MIGVQGGCEKGKESEPVVSFGNPTEDKLSFSSPSQEPLESLGAELQKMSEIDEPYHKCQMSRIINARFAAPRIRSISVKRRRCNMSELEGLSVELRKAVITGSDIAEWERKQVDERLEGVEWAEAVVKAMKREYLPADLVAQDRRKLAKEYFEDLCEIFNSLTGDLEIDIPEGENGAVSYEAAYQAIKKYTFRVLREKIRKVEEAFR